MVSVIGLIVIQYNYLKIGLNLAQVKFNQNIGKTIKTVKSELTNNNKLTFLLGTALTNDDTYFNTELDSVKNAAGYFLSSFLEDRLLENGIKTDFSYKLFVKDSDLKIQSINYIENEDKLKKYTIDLLGYLPNLADKNVVLELKFNNINEYFLFQLNGLNIPSVIFLIAIIFVVIWVLKSLYWQQSIITMTNDFINNLTHELKTPVFSIGLATKMLQEKETEETKTYLEIIKSQNDRLKQHIDKVLQLASLDKKTNALQFTETNFKPHLKKLCEEFSNISKMENVSFTYKLTDIDYTLNCEPIHLINAINNLLDNSKKYKAESPKIELKSIVKNNKLHISIKDNGIGIQKKDQKNIFKKHFRVSSGDLYTVKGYGLGLNYVKKIVTLHKGTIDLESELHKGTLITIKLPIVKT
ncbi:two-component system phosphate regulon sensor histidine kinase PhoR [Lutibacter oceani]|uniref:histidine kinase n=2 Tax=Lutibacter oceani TaxID=1853311 RepID=A0A3D9S375_9FLAO|nr:two-component system phosphate regulon sensor histidine kinase PhoR [Lutibacter oceani]